MSVQIVWFKRDLRIEDHAALTQAAAAGPVLPLYILEPPLWQQPDMSHRQYQFLRQSLGQLQSELSALGQPLVIRTGDAVEVLSSLCQSFNVAALWSHQETWNGWTYQRDQRVAAWAQARHLPWYEPVQNGVIRRLGNRDGWAARWYDVMSKPCWQPPLALPWVADTTGSLPAPEALGLQDDACTHPQAGGRDAGLALLHSFLNQRGEHYSRAMSSPNQAEEACSRLSPHLAFGTLSMREVYQATLARQAQLRGLPQTSRGRWPSALRSFQARLRWHCHFMQKLEDQPGIEFEAMHSAYEGLRDECDPRRLQAWQAGQTGFPMVDACMRSLIATGWLNFRMRAMLMSFASYHLWLPWREPALHMARLFTDYEPGIHFSQVQMQSGTTGINTLRIYNPIKQGQDQDPEGQFIRRWVPELADMPTAHIHTPWHRPSQMKSYPVPLVDEKQARKQAADRLYRMRKDQAHRNEAVGIVQRHGSRKRPGRRPAQENPRYQQGELPF